jgi:uncharacterized protein (DUF305 family)
MPVTLDPDVDDPAPPTDGGGDEGDGPTPWWQQPWKLAVLGVALVFLGLAAGAALFGRDDPGPSQGSVDVGFLQDMRWHHDQAVRMSLLLLNKEPSEQDPTMRGVAADILRTQQFEAGVMAGQLRAWGVPEANESGIGMAWMGMSVPIDLMPGMATDEQLDELRAATGREADLLFLRLMRAHHEGGLHMAIDALARAGTTEARDLAQSIITSQEFELGELRRLESQLTAT